MNDCDFITILCTTVVTHQVLYDNSTPEQRNGSLMSAICNSRNYLKILTRQYRLSGPVIG